MSIQRALIQIASEPMLDAFSQRGTCGSGAEEDDEFSQLPIRRGTLTLHGSIISFDLSAAYLKSANQIDLKSLDDMKSVIWRRIEVLLTTSL